MVAKKMLKLSLGLALASAAAVGSTDIFPVLRRLEDQEAEDTYYDKSLASGKCFRVKIAEDNDDEGNSYFYNGSYRAQFIRYTSFFMCDVYEVCTQYVADLDEYVELTTDFVQQYCQACQNNCRRRRRLEEKEEEEGNDNGNVVADCNSCYEECQPMYMNSNYENDAADFLQCQESYNDGQLQYYSAPQCGSNGQIVIGLFYDDECSIKTNLVSSDVGLEFNYNAFETFAGMKIDCSLNPDVCADLADLSVMCSNNMDDDDAKKLCKTATQAAKVQIYYKKPFYKKVPWAGIFFFVAILGFLVSFLSYTYYVRHKKQPMANLDGKVDLPNLS